MASLASINIKFTADLSSLSSSMQNVSRDLKKAGKQMQSVGKSMSIGLTAPLLLLGRSAFNTFADFEDGMAKVKAISGATSEEFKKLKLNAEELGASTRYTASQVAELQLNYSKLGFKPDEILKATEATLNLALATGEDLASSAEVAASTLKGFGLSADQTVRVTDVMAKSFSSSALDLTKFSTAMSVLAPVAKTAGVSLEDATGMLSVLVNAGLDASTAGTGLRNIFLDLADKGMSLEEAFSAIQNSSNKNKTAMELFGKRGATVATVLSDNIDVANNLSESYLNASGSAAEMAAIMDNTAKGSLARMKSAIEGMAISFGEQLAPYISKVADFIGKLSSKFTSLSPATKKIIVIVAGVVAAIGPLLLILGSVMTLLPGIISGISAMGAAFTLMTGPIGLVVAAIGGLIYLIVRNWDKVKKALIDTANYFIDLYNESTLFRAGVEYIVMAFKNLFAVVKTVVNFIIDGFKLVGKQIYNTFSSVGSVIKAVLTGNLKEIPSILTKGFKDAVKNGKDFAKELSDDFKAGAADISKNVGDALDNTFKGKKYKLLGENVDASGVKDGVEEAVAEGTENGVVNGLSNGIAKGGESLKANTEVFFEKQISDLKALQSTLADNNREWLLYQQRIDEVQAKLNDLQKPLQSVQEAVQMPSVDNSEYTESLIKNSEYFKGMVESIGQQGEVLKEKQDALNAEMTAKAQALNEAYQTIGDAFTSLFGSYAQGFVESLNITNEGMKAFVQSLVGTITKLIAMALSASMANSIQGATQTGAATGPAAAFTTPAFIATAIAGILSAFAAIPKFETGGIVGGTSYFGDKILARINSGELILNQKQQARLYDMMQPSVGTGTEISLGLGTRISGSDLEIVIDRAVKKNLRKK